MAVGLGNKSYDDKTPSNNDYSSGASEIAVGLEFGIGNIFFSGETGFESISTGPTEGINMKISGGIHYYF